VANEQNIIPYQFTSEQNREEAARNGAKGGVASGAARRRKRSLKEAADLFLSLPVNDNRIYNMMVMAGVDAEDIDYQMAVVVGMTSKAISGDAKAAKILLEMLGENTKEDPVEDHLIRAKELLGGIDGVIE